MQRNAQLIKTNMANATTSNWQHDRRSRHARGYGTAWDKARKQAMQRDMWLCQPCKRQGRATPATECDHITPKSQGGTDKLHNLQAICHECHATKTQKEAAQAQGRAMPIVKPVFNADGLPDGW